MTDPLRPGLQPISHLKAGPTTSSSRSTALPSPTTLQPPSRPSSRLRTQRASSKDDPDATSEKATTALIRRILCPQTSSYGSSNPQPPEELLPPLTSSNDVDRQLYALLAIIIKEFVYSWYSKITTDQALVNEVLQVIAHCTRALEQRLRQIDVARLALDEIPALVEAHVHSYRLARQRSHLSGLPTSYRALYHELNPHPGLSPVPDTADPDTIAEQSENEAVYRRLLANGSLAVLLPTEDLENTSLRALVVDVIADLILGNQISGRACEGFFIWETIAKFAARVGQRQSSDDSKSGPDSQINRLEKFGLLSAEDEVQPSASFPATAWVWNVLQAISFGYVVLRFIVLGLLRVASSPGPSHGVDVSVASTAFGGQKKVRTDSNDVKGKRPVLDYRMYSMVSEILGIPWRMPWLSGLLALFQYLVLAGPGKVGEADGILDRFLRETIEEYVLSPTLLPNLLLATRTALFPANTRLSSQIAAVNPGGDNSGDQTASRLASLSSIAADAPSNVPIKREQGIHPSKTAIASIKRECATRILGIMPRTAARAFLSVPSSEPPPSYSGDRTCSNTNTSRSLAISPPAPFVASGDLMAPQGNDPPLSSHLSAPTPPVAEGGHIAAERLHTDKQPGVDLEELYLLETIEKDFLDVFADSYCNKHLIYSIIEMVLAKVLPEMTERSVQDLMEDRGVASAPPAF